MIEIKTDWTFENTHLFKDGKEIPFVRDFKITMCSCPILEITKLTVDGNGHFLAEHPVNGEAFAPFEKMVTSDFKVTQI